MKEQTAHPNPGPSQASRQISGSINHYFVSQEKIRQHKTIGGDAKKKYRANQLLF